MAMLVRRRQYETMHRMLGRVRRMAFRPEVSSSRTQQQQQQPRRCSSNTATPTTSGKAQARKGLYKSQAVKTPSIRQLEKLAEEIGIESTEEELLQYRETIGKMVLAYNVIADLPSPQLPVKYPRCPGHRPAPEDNPYNAWYWKTDIKGAEEGSLEGKTVGIKDNIPVSGVPMMNGSRMLEGYTPEFDATVVTRVLDAGGRILGKTTCEDFCGGGNSFTSATGPVLNPHDKTKSAGGSSSGNAVLVATGEIDMAIGSDQGGSIRIPSSWTGVVGMKPTYGLVPYTGAVSLDGSIDHLGPMARTVADCATLLTVLAGKDDDHDPRQNSAKLRDIPNYADMIGGNIDDISIGIVKQGFSGCESDVKGAVQGAIDHLVEAGATAQDISIPLHAYGHGIILPFFVEGGCEVGLSGGGYGWKGHYPVSLREAIARGLKSKSIDLDHQAKLNSLMGSYMRQNYHGHYYAKAQNLSKSLRQAYDAALKVADVLIMPTTPFKAPALPSRDLTVPDYFRQAGNMSKNTCPFNITGHPALNITAGFAGDLPIGMQIVGRHFEDDVVLRVARAWEDIAKTSSDQTGFVSAWSVTRPQ